MKACIRVRDIVLVHFYRPIDRLLLSCHLCVTCVSRKDTYSVM